MRKLWQELTSAWPYATLMCCLFVVFAFIDGRAHDWPWAAAEAVVGALWFLIAHHSWENP